MSDRLMAEIERRVRVSVEVDIAQFCAVYPDERAKFKGTDEEYVRDFLDEEAWSLVRDGSVGNEDGLRVTEEYDETETSILGVV